MTIRPLSLLLAFALLAACSTGDDASPEPDTSTQTPSGDDGGFTGPIKGDLLASASDTDDQVEVGVTSAVLYLRLTDATRKEAAEEMDQDVPEDGLGGAIGRAVTGFVSEALQTAVQIPLEDVDALRYENGRLFIDAEGGDMNVRINHDQDEGIPFEEAEAQSLIDAFERAR